MLAIWMNTNIRYVLDIIFFLILISIKKVFCINPFYYGKIKRYACVPSFPEKSEILKVQVQ